MLKIRCIIIITFTLSTIFNCRSQDLRPFRVNNLWGYQHQQGLIKISPQYQYASKFIFDIAVVAKHDSLGAIDKNNTLIIPFKYGYLRALDSLDFLFGFRSKYFGEYNIGVMTRNKKVKIPAEYSHISKLKSTYLIVKQLDSIIGKNSIGDIRSINNLYGLLDSTGKVLIPCEYGYINYVNNDLIDVSTSGSKVSHALFDRKGKQLTEFDYMVFGPFIDGLAKARISNKFGFINTKGKVAIPIQFDYCEDFSNGYALIKQVDKWGAINKRGKIILKTKYSYDEVNALVKQQYSK